MTHWTISNRTLRIIRADLTQLDVDAIVNAANSGLAGGGGVDGAIHRAAGQVRLQDACQRIIAERGPLEPGAAVITPGFNLKARMIIHTVGPIWRGGENDEPDQLRKAYRNSLMLAYENGLRSIAFPAISCGVYGYPAHEASRIALTAIAKGLEDGLVQEAIVALHTDDMLRTWTEISRNLFSR